jgi:hypothetical protein
MIGLENFLRRLRGKERSTTQRERAATFRGTSPRITPVEERGARARHGFVLVQGYLSAVEHGRNEVRGGLRLPSRALAEVRRNYQLVARTTDAQCKPLDMI